MGGVSERLNTAETAPIEKELWTGRGAFIFPGQGAQRRGMGKELWDASLEARMVFTTAESVFPGITNTCFEDPDDALRRTDIGQLASGVVDVAAAAAVFEKYPELIGKGPVVGAGISFGELPSLVVAGSIEFMDFLRFIKERGDIMQRVGERNPGRMVAVPGLPEDVVRNICDEAGVFPGIWYPGMTIISGGNAGIDRAVELVRLKRGRPQETGIFNPFHSPLMAPAQEEIAPYLDRVAFENPRYPIVLSAQGGTVATTATQIKEGLLAQIVGPANMSETMVAMKRLGAQVFLEFCPSPVLTNHIKRGNPEVKAIPIHDLQSLQNLNLSFAA